MAVLHGFHHSASTHQSDILRQCWQEREDQADSVHMLSFDPLMKISMVRSRPALSMPSRPGDVD